MRVSALRAVLATADAGRVTRPANVGKAGANAGVKAVAAVGVAVVLRAVAAEVVAAVKAVATEAAAAARVPAARLPVAPTMTAV